MLTGTGRPRDEQVGEIFNHDTKEMHQLHGLRHRRGGGHGRGAAGAPARDPGRPRPPSCRPSRPPPRPSAACSWSTAHRQRDRHELRARCLQSGQSGQRGHRPGVDSDVHLLGIRAAQGDPLELSGQQLPLQQHVLRRERRAERLDAFPRDQKGFRPDESVVSVFKGWYVMNSLHAAASRTVGEEVTLQLSVIPGLRSSATCSWTRSWPSSSRRSTVSRASKISPVDLRERSHPEREILGHRHHRHAGGSAGQRRRGAVRLVEEAARRRAHPALPRSRERSTSWWWAERRARSGRPPTTAAGARRRWTTGGRTTTNSRRARERGPAGASRPLRSGLPISWMLTLPLELPKTAIGSRSEGSGARACGRLHERSW